MFFVSFVVQHQQQHTNFCRVQKPHQEIASDIFGKVCVMFSDYISDTLSLKPSQRLNLTRN